MEKQEKNTENLVIGLGDIGQAIYSILDNTDSYTDVKVIDLNKNIQDVIDCCKYMWVCFPYSENFVDEVRKYQEIYKPEITIIFSTVAIGTIEKISNAVHAPIEGRHPSLKYYIESWEFIVSYNDKNILEIAKKVFNKYFDLGRITFVQNTKTTEICKLLSTLNYGVNIEFSRFAADMFKKHGCDYTFFKSYNSRYNKLYDCSTKFRRYILDPPEGPITGHCIVPNAEILRRSEDDNVFINIVCESGE